MKPFLQRTWAQIDLDAIEYNYLKIREAVNPKAKICCVVKADAYGHGAVTVANEYEKLGADYFAVSNIEEALQLRSGGITKPILILGYTPADMADVLSENNISQAVFSLEYAKLLSEAAVSCGVKIKIHIKIDTGMSRIGFFYQKPDRDYHSIDEICTACTLENLESEGVFTHFSVADEGENGEDYTNIQFALFCDAIVRLEEMGIKFEIRHCANSAATIDYPQYHLDMVRPGVILYGLMPSEKIRKEIELKPAMQLKSVISHIKEISSETSVSYGRTYISENNMKLATVPIGYADGYMRAYSGKAQMLINGKRASIVGRVCMDQLMLDVTDISDIKMGDTVTVFGEDKGEKLLVEELSNLSDTINYEIVCLVGKRVPRIYYRNGEMTDYLNYINP